MTPGQVEILELTAWGLDENPYRPLMPSLPDAPSRPLSAHPALLAEATALLAPHLPPIHARPDLASEFAHLRWSIAVVDLRALQAFQRRLILDPTQPVQSMPDPADTLALLDLAFPPPRSTAHLHLSPNTLQSTNPDLTLRPTPLGFELYGGSPFLEVARLATQAGPRFFLRDGYHRACRLLHAGVHAIPAILIEADTMADVFPPGPWFFSQKVLLTSSAPFVEDFLNPRLTVRYTRPRLFKTITITETMEPHP